VSAHDASINGGSMNARSSYEPRDATCYRAVANLGRPTRSATCNSFSRIRTTSTCTCTGRSRRDLFPRSRRDFSHGCNWTRPPA